MERFFFYNLSTVGIISIIISMIPTEMLKLCKRSEREDGAVETQSRWKEGCEDPRG